MWVIDSDLSRAAHGLEEEVSAGSRVPLGRGFAGRIAAERRPIAIPDVATAAQWRRLSPRMLLVHPVIELGRAIPALIGVFVAMLVLTITFRSRKA